MAHTDPRRKKDLLLRLSRIEGQVRGITRMVEEGEYCVDILNQISAVRSALNSVGQILMEGHIRGCVADAIKHDGGDESIEELLQLIKKYAF
ncbi:MAG: metal-sensitive transcriptional regulator [Firmicutes bacterium]|jgi:DNA-binding FrmR family transcriptional regulator|nr:metal-sensitive transcriptional regulator [Bacillota bacterium]